MKRTGKPFSGARMFLQRVRTLVFSETKRCWPFSSFRAVLLASSAFLCVEAAVAVESDTPENPVEFFKRSLKAPSEIEYFEASSRALRDRFPVRLRPKGITTNPQSVQFFEGARAGRDFYLRDNSTAEKMITGRSGRNSYTIVSNTVAFGLDAFDAQNPNRSDRISQAVESAFRLTTQFTQMGLGDLSPESVSWTGNEFVGVNDSGRTQYGRLELSNNTPWRLTVSWERGGTPLKIVTYAYPESRLHLNGYPEKIILSTHFEDGLHPFLELTLAKVQFAERKLAKEFFDPAKFITVSTRFTNTWGMTKLTSISPKGTVSVDIAPPSVVIEHKSWRQRVVLWSFLLVTIIPIVLYFRAKKPNIPEQTNEQ